MSKCFLIYKYYHFYLFYFYFCFFALVSLDDFIKQHTFIYFCLSWTPGLSNLIAAANLFFNFKISIRNQHCYSNKITIQAGQIPSDIRRKQTFFTCKQFRHIIFNLCHFNFNSALSPKNRGYHFESGWCFYRLSKHTLYEPFDSFTAKVNYSILIEIILLLLQ